jgi:hypothetical protein
MDLRKTSHIVRSLAAVLAGAVALAFVAVPAQAQAAAAPPANVVSSAPMQLQAAQVSGDYWTAAKMAAAKSADAPNPTTLKSSKVATTSAAETAPETKPVTINPTAGTIAAPASTTALTTGIVARPFNNLPDRLNGKVFFSDGSKNFVCSGTVVNSLNKDMVDTAGHCVSNGAGRFYTNWIFVPGYSSSATGCTTTAGCFPYGKWTARQLITKAEWHTFANLKQDLGYAVLNTLGGKHIVNVLGGQGTQFNQSRTQTWNDFGYPQAAPYNGFDQQLCISGRLADDNPSTRPGPLTVRISCNMTAGSSGGGWLINLPRTGLGFVNSHNSYKYAGTSLANTSVMYGPYYGSEALSLFNAAQVL